MADLDGVYEEHEYSEVLTATYYDFLMAAYRKELQEIVGSAGEPENGGHRVRALMRASRLTSRLMLRAVDYCPPVDVRFDDFAKAALRSDYIAYPTDPRNFRELARDVFLARGIGASADDLEWRRELSNSDLRGLDVETIGSSKTDAYEFVDANRMALGLPPKVNLKVTNVYRTKKLSANGYRPPREIVVEFVWAENVRLTGPLFGEFQGTDVPLWCGGTLVFSRDGNLLHYALKADNPERRKDLVDYVRHLVQQRRFTIDHAEQGFGGADRGGSVVARVESNHLRLERSAAFRHVERRA